MGFQEDMYTGMGNVAKASTPSISGVSENMMDIYNYNTIVFHMNTAFGEPEDTAGNMVLGYSGCSHNGMPMWTFHDGFYDGDFDINSGRHHHHKLHYNDRFGSATCNGASHILRWGGDGAGGSWEVVTHGKISAWTSANTRNFFGIQGTGNTETGQIQSDVSGVGKSADGGLGSWVMISADTTINGIEYGIWNTTTAATQSTTGQVGLTGITTDGVIN